LPPQSDTDRRRSENDRRHRCDLGQAPPAERPASIGRSGSHFRVGFIGSGDCTGVTLGALFYRLYRHFLFLLFACRPDRIVRTGISKKSVQPARNSNTTDQ